MSPRERINRVVFLREIIRDYYRLRPLEEPSDLHRREIALESLEDGVYIRHLSFPYMNQLYDYITSTKTPLHLYYSSALYAIPDADRMENKIWEGSELMFDIDVDKYENCIRRFWICPETGHISEQSINSCPGGGRVVEYSVIPWDCIIRAWNNVLRLVETLREDLGYTRIRVYFSGNRGFHVKISDPGVLPLDREARRAIADYVSCEEISVDRVFPRHGDRVVFSKPEYGLRKRVLGIASRLGLIEKKRTRRIGDIELLYFKHLDSILREICIEIDRAVTMDITRLSRFGNSLNMKAGLRVRELDLDIDISKLNYSEFSAFKGSIKIRPLITGRIPVLDQLVDLTRNTVVKVDAYIGIYLVLKELALPVDSSELRVEI